MPSTRWQCVSEHYHTPPPWPCPGRGAHHAEKENKPNTTDRGEGANHAIVDVLDFVELVMPQLRAGGADKAAAAVGLRAALDRYEDRVVARTRPAVLASRQACIDAHQWDRINEKSPLLSRRLMNLVFDESDMSTAN